MPSLTQLIGSPTASSSPSSAEVAALKARITALENKPNFDPKSLQDAINTLVSNEKVDDAAVEALEKALKAIDLTPYAKTVDIKPYDDTKLKADLKTLGDDASKIAKNLASAIARIAALEEVKIIRSSSPPDLTRDWHRWDYVNRDLLKWEVTVREWIRITKNSAMPVGLRVEPLPPATDDNAEEISAGTFQNTVPGGAQLTYKRVRSLSDIDQLTFPAGIYNNSAWIFLDAAKSKLGTYGGGAAIVPDATSIGQGFSSIPDDAKFVQYELTRVDGTKVLYTYSVAKA